MNMYRHPTWESAFGYAWSKAYLSGYRYTVRRSPVGWWLVSRQPGMTEVSAATRRICGHFLTERAGERGART